MTPSSGQAGDGVERPTAAVIGPGEGPGWLDQACLKGQPGQVGTPPASGFVADPVQVGADGPHADVDGGDLGIRASLRATSVTSSRSRGLNCAAPDDSGGSTAVSMMASSAAVAAVIAVPRSSAALTLTGPSACLAARRGAWRRCSSWGTSVKP